MKKSKFTESQIAFALKQAETGVSVEEITHKLGINQATFYNWKKKFGGLGVPELRKLRQMEEEIIDLREVNQKLNTINESIKSNTDKHNEFLKELGLDLI